METFEVDAECKACGATGLYEGMGEHGGDAVVCSTCRGTGCHRISVTYAPFKARNGHKTALRVFRVNPGVFTSPDVVPGGVPVERWLVDPESVNEPGAEMRQHTCPAWWYQSADYGKKPGWRDCDNSFGRSFSECPSFAHKSACWARWDRENGGE